MRSLLARSGILQAARAAVAASLLAACATGDVSLTTAATPSKPDTGNWSLEPRKDPIAGHGATIARLYVLLEGLYISELELSCFKGKPVVRLRFSKRLKTGTDKTGSLAYRFDERPGRELKARFFARPHIILVEDKAEVARFVEEMADAELLQLRVHAITARPFTVKFTVRGAPYAIEAAYANCPLPGAPAKPAKVAGT